MIMLLLSGSVQMELIERMLVELVILLQLDHASPLHRRKEIGASLTRMQQACFGSSREQKAGIATCQPFFGSCSAAPGAIGTFTMTDSEAASEAKQATSRLIASSAGSACTGVHEGRRLPSGAFKCALRGRRYGHLCMDSCRQICFIVVIDIPNARAASACGRSKRSAIAA